MALPNTLQIKSETKNKKKRLILYKNLIYQKLPSEERGSLNWLIFVDQHKVSITFTGEFYKTLEEQTIPVMFVLIQSLETQHFPDGFYEESITLAPKTWKRLQYDQTSWVWISALLLCSFVIIDKWLMSLCLSFLICKELSKSRTTAWSHEGSYGHWPRLSPSNAAEDPMGVDLWHTPGNSKIYLEQGGFAWKRSAVLQRWKQWANKISVAVTSFVWAQIGEAKGYLS